ncbi:MAG: DcaP family trimeric outer membrane transporter [Arenicella sp.]
MKKTHSKNWLKLSVLAASTSLAATVSVVKAAEIDVYGYVKADFIYDLDQDLGDELDSSGVNVGAESQSHFRAHARQSRIGFKSEVEGAKLKVEGDFFGGGGNEVVSNSRSFRIRHAYGQYKNVLIGQTWSTFMDFSALPATVDFAGPAAAVFARQTQLRYTLGNLSLAIENPSPLVGGEETVLEELPDFIAKYSMSNDNFSFYAAGLLQTVEIEGGAADGESESYFGLHAGGNVKLGDSTLMLSVVSNAGRYGTAGFANPTFVVVGDQLQTNDYTGLTLAYNLKNFNIAYGNVSFDEDYLAATDKKDISTFHVNYSIKASKNVTYMFEFSAAKNELVNGESDTAKRLQFAAQYNF